MRGPVEDCSVFSFLAITVKFAILPPALKGLAQEESETMLAMKRFMIAMAICLGCRGAAAQPLIASGGPARMQMMAPAMAPFSGAAAAPGPSAGGRQTANGMFILPAARVTFKNATAVLVSGTPNTTQYVQYAPALAAGSVLRRNFYGQAFAGPNGDWLNGPQAVIQGLVNGSFATVLLQLHAPHFDGKDVRAMFAYKVCNGSEAKLPVAGGLANSIALSAANDNTGDGSPRLMSQISPSTTMLNATMFVDVANIAKYTATTNTAEKAGLIYINLGGASAYYGSFNRYYYGNSYDS